MTQVVDYGTRLLSITKLLSHVLCESRDLDLLRGAKDSRVHRLHEPPGQELRLISHSRGYLRGFEPAPGYVFETLSVARAATEVGAPASISIGAAGVASVDPARVVAEPSPPIEAPRVVPATIPVVTARPWHAHIEVARLHAAFARVHFAPFRFAFVILAKEAIFAVRCATAFFAFGAVLALPAGATIAHTI